VSSKRTKWTTRKGQNLTFAPKNLATTSSNDDESGALPARVGEDSVSLLSDASLLGLSRPEKGEPSGDAVGFAGESIPSVDDEPNSSDAAFVASRSEASNYSLSEDLLGRFKVSGNLLGEVTPHAAPTASSPPGLEPSKRSRKRARGGETARRLSFGDDALSAGEGDSEGVGSDSSDSRSGPFTQLSPIKPAKRIRTTSSVLPAGPLPGGLVRRWGPVRGSVSPPRVEPEVISIDSDDDDPIFVDLRDDVRTEGVDSALDVEDAMNNSRDWQRRVEVDLTGPVPVVRTFYKKIVHMNPSQKHLF